MRAIGIHEFGGRDKLQLLDLPEPKVPPDFVKIRLRAAGVNPVDWKLREGRLEPRFPVVFPVVPGWDAAGVVAEVGPAVTEFALGDEVYSYCVSTSSAKARTRSTSRSPTSTSRASRSRFRSSRRPRSRSRA